MQHTCSVGRAAHARVGDPHHVANALLEQLLRNREHAPLRHTRSAERSGGLQDQHGILGNGQIRAVDARFQIVVIFEDDCGAGMIQQLGRGRRGLDDGSVGRQAAAQNSRPAACGDADSRAGE